MKVLNRQTRIHDSTSELTKMTPPGYFYYSLKPSPLSTHRKTQHRPKKSELGRKANGKNTRTPHQKIKHEFNSQIGF